AAAMVAGAAGDDERHHDAVALAEGTDRLAGFDHLAHEFMAENVARFHARDHAVIEMQVRTADRGRGHPDDGIARIDDRRIVDGLDADMPFALPGKVRAWKLLSLACSSFAAGRHWRFRRFP